VLASVAASFSWAALPSATVVTVAFHPQPAASLAVDPPRILGVRRLAAAFDQATSPPKSPARSARHIKHRKTASDVILSDAKDLIH
jgi:hypothetical protein